MNWLARLNQIDAPKKLSKTIQKKLHMLQLVEWSCDILLLHQCAWFMRLFGQKTNRNNNWSPLFALWCSSPLPAAIAASLATEKWTKFLECSKLPPKAVTLLIKNSLNKKQPCESHTHTHPDGITLSPFGSDVHKHTQRLLCLPGGSSCRDPGQWSSCCFISWHYYCCLYHSC